MVDSNFIIKNKKYQTFARYFEQLDCTHFAFNEKDHRRSCWMVKDQW